MTDEIIAAQLISELVALDPDLTPTARQAFRQRLIDALRSARAEGFRAGVEASAEKPAHMAAALFSNGKARVNQVDRHTAHVLREAEKAIRSLTPPQESA